MIDSPRRAVAVVGSGPSGFFTAAGLLALPGLQVSVDMIERLPTPWGLVRAGVAPDHPKIKSVSAQFDKTASHERFRFYGNVEVGADVSRDDLLARYDAVVYCVGAPADRSLGIPGEELPGSVAAAEFVGWYNGHPDFRDRQFDLRVERAVVVGNGNVALDVARILTTPPELLSRTDIADHALAALRGSTISEVVVLGRRGAVQAAFTTAELRELHELTGAHVDVDPAQVAPGPGEDDLAPGVQRNLAALRDFAGRADPGAPRRVTLRFLRSPVAILGQERVRGIVLGYNDLVHSGGVVRVRDTGARETMSTELVLRAVGHRGRPVGDVPFDQHAGAIPHRDGRIVGTDREYVAGWIKRGPSGVIGTNKKCAMETVRAVAADLAARPAVAGSDEPIDSWLRRTKPELVDLGGWRDIDAAEQSLGAEQGRPRVKLCTRRGLLAAAGIEKERTR